MERSVELALIDELRGLKAARSAFLDESVVRSPVEHYTDARRFMAEQAAILRRRPVAICHVSEVPDAGAFVTRKTASADILVARDRDNNIRAFHNVCRHRGTRLVREQVGCRHRFTCPYHAWTYANDGALISAPQFDAGFGQVDKAQLGLTGIAAQVRHGLVWVCLQTDEALDLPAELARDVEDLALDEMVIAVEHTETRQANWKILVEGGIEAYHFRVAHKATIGPYFENNLSSYATFGPHMRTIIPRTSLADLDDGERDQWRLRDHANILYTLFPTCQMLVQQDHIVWIVHTPLAADCTRLRIATLVPKSAVTNSEHWERNHAITRTTLAEDFDIGESIQAGLSSGANDALLFGRFEGALGVFNRTVQQLLADPA